MGEPGWAVVVPVKRLADAKTRLRGAVGHGSHSRLVLALATDTAQAALVCPVVTEVLVVTDDPATATAMTAIGARVVPDTPSAGLNAAVVHGAGMVSDPRRWVAVIAADLPALRPTELARALREAARTPQRGFVPDAGGTGTTLLAAPPGIALDPRFGPGSAAAHAASGARRLTGDWPSVRQDVDTAADLAQAARLGLGRHSASLWPSGATRHDDRAAEGGRVDEWFGAGSGSGSGSRSS